MSGDGAVTRDVNVLYWVVVHNDISEVTLTRPQNTDCKPVKAEKAEALCLNFNKKESEKEQSWFQVMPPASDRSNTYCCFTSCIDTGTCESPLCRKWIDFSITHNRNRAFQLLQLFPEIVIPCFTRFYTSRTPQVNVNFGKFGRSTLLNENSKVHKGEASISYQEKTTHGNLELVDPLPSSKAYNRTILCKGMGRDIVKWSPQLRQKRKLYKRKLYKRIWSKRAPEKMKRKTMSPETRVVVDLAQELIKDTPSERIRTFIREHPLDVYLSQCRDLERLLEADPEVLVVWVRCDLCMLV
jgi:hypothetical protein